MGFFIFLLIVFFILILFVFTCTIIKTILFFMTKYKYETKYLIIPSFLMVFIFMFVLFAWYFTITKILKIDIINIYFNEFLKISSSNNSDIASILTLSVIYIIIGIILQAFSYFTVNINYYRVSGFFRKTFRKLFNINTRSTMEENDLKIDERPENLSYSNAFISSLFTFSLLFFFLLSLLAIGNLISSKIV